MQKVGNFKSLPRNQVSDDLLWHINGNNNCFLKKTQGVVFSFDPTNLSGLNLKRDSGITSQEGIGITNNTKLRVVKERKAKKTALVTRFDLNIKTRRQLGKGKLVALPKKNNKTLEPTTNHAVYASQRGLTTRALVKVLKRGLPAYRPDLQKLAILKVRKLHHAKRRGKNLNKKDAKASK